MVWRSRIAVSVLDRRASVSPNRWLRGTSGFKPGLHLLAVGFLPACVDALVCVQALAGQAVFGMPVGDARLDRVVGHRRQQRRLVEAADRQVHALGVVELEAERRAAMAAEAAPCDLRRDEILRRREPADLALAQVDVGGAGIA